MRSKAGRPSNLRFEALNAFVDRSLANLAPAEVRVWLILFRDARPPRWDARASLDDIARRAGIDRRSASRAVKSLRAKSMLKTTKRGGLNTGPSSYRVAPVPME